MDSIRKVSTFLVYILTILLIVYPLFYMFVWYFGDFSFIANVAPYITGGEFSTSYSKTITTPEGLISLETVKWTVLSKSTYILGEIFSVFPFYLGLLFLRKIFKSYKKGKIFDIKTISYYRYLGYAFFLDALVSKPMTTLLEVLAVSLSNPPGHRWISLKFGNTSVEEIFVGSIIIVISWVMGEAYKLQEEQHLTV